MGEIVPIYRTDQGATKSRGWGRITAYAVMLPVLAVILSSCLGANYTFISHSTSGGGDTYFKVPSSWSVYNQSQIYASAKNRPTPSQLNAIEAVSWATIFTTYHMRRFDANIGFQSASPVGLVQALELSGSQRDSFSLASLRSLILPDDPLANSSSSGYKYSVLSYDEFVRPGGYRGSRFMVNVTTPSGIKTTFMQEAMVDPSTNWVYFIGVGCDRSCFKVNQSSITGIVNSWSVKAVR